MLFRSVGRDDLEAGLQIVGVVVGEALAAEAGQRGFTEVYAGTKNLGRFLRTLGWTFQEMIGFDKESIGLFRWRPEPAGSDPNTKRSTR